MKNLILLIIVANFFGMEQQQKNIWICSEVGTIDNQLVMIISKFEVQPAIEQNEIEKQFGLKVQKDLEDFNSVYAPTCRNFSEVEKLQVFLKKMIKQAQERSFKIFWVDFVIKNAN